MWGTFRLHLGTKYTYFSPQVIDLVLIMFESLRLDMGFTDI